MEYEIVWTENAFEDLREIIFYLEDNWSSKVSYEFLEKCFLSIELISKFPSIGIQSEKDKNVRKFLITKQNALYYGLEKNTILLLNFFDTRQDPGKSKF